MACRYTGADLFGGRTEVLYSTATTQPFDRRGLAMVWRRHAVRTVCWIVQDNLKRAVTL